MIDFPTWFAGTVTIVALIGLGIFIYPWLLRKPWGAGAVGAFTLALGFLFYAFDSSGDAPFAVSALLAVLWALAPVAAGTLVYRLQRRSSAAKSGG